MAYTWNAGIPRTSLGLVTQYVTDCEEHLQLNLPWHWGRGPGGHTQNLTNTKLMDAQPSYIK